MSEFLGIDTSNYTTSLALSRDGKIVKNLKKLLDVKEGQRGLRQSDAVFAHTVNLPRLFDEMGSISPDAVGVSVSPRDAEGSYMPCFLAGVSCATAVAASLGVPLYRFSHQAGHIAAALYSCGAENLITKSFLAFHVSGGTTEVLLCDNMSITRLGGTRDISAGMAIDRTGVLMGLKFPCGKELEALAGDLTQNVKPGRISVSGLDCNLSGLENKVVGLLSDCADRQYVAAYVLSFVGATVEKMAENATSTYPGLPIIFSGGVMSNRFMRGRLENRFGGYFAAPEFSCDNAAGTARLAAMRHCGEI